MMEYLDKNKCRVYCNRKNMIIKFIDEDIVCINELDDLAGLELVDYLPEIFASVYLHKELLTYESECRLQN